VQLFKTTRTFSILSTFATHFQASNLRSTDSEYQTIHLLASPPLQLGEELSRDRVAAVPVLYFYQTRVIRATSRQQYLQPRCRRWFGLLH
jgi:hypothetical protein